MLRSLHDDVTKGKSKIRDPGSRRRRETPASQNVTNESVFLCDTSFAAFAVIFCEPFLSTDGSWVPNALSFISGADLCTRRMGRSGQDGDQVVESGSAGDQYAFSSLC